MFAVNYQKRKKKALKVAVWGTDSVATLQLIKKKKKKNLLSLLLSQNLSCKEALCQ